jgi:hypothetical protein
VRLAAAALGLAVGADAWAQTPAPEAIGWPEAVARLAAERQRAVTCAGLARTLPGDAAAPLRDLSGLAPISHAAASLLPVLGQLPQRSSLRHGVTCSKIALQAPVGARPDRSKQRSR